jgi:hypothetical protein
MIVAIKDDDLIWLLDQLRCAASWAFLAGVLRSRSYRKLRNEAPVVSAGDPAPAGATLHGRKKQFFGLDQQDRRRARLLRGRFQPTHPAIGGAFEQIFGANQQVSHLGESYKEAETAARVPFQSSGGLA